MYAAPTQKGGFCHEVEFKVRGGKTLEGWTGCSSPSVRSAPIGTIVGGFMPEDPRIINGSVTAPEATALVLIFEDGRRETLPLTWISEPIDAAFFAFAAPVERTKPGRRPKALIALDSEGREVILLWGQVGSQIASIDLTYEDGEQATLNPVEGFVLYEIPSRHYRKGHRLSVMIGRAEDGRIVARHEVDTETPGSYPCMKPKRSATLVDGEGAFACP